MKKYLIVQFKNAGFFSYYKTKDFVCIGKERTKRETMLRFKEPITKYQVSNLIHVLFGDRPVPTFREVFYKPVPRYQQMAEDSYVKIDSYMKPESGKVPAHYPRETFSVRKAVSDAWNTQVTMYWEKLKLLLKKENDENPDWLYEEFLKVVKMVFKFNSIEEVSFENVKTKILKLKNENPAIYEKFIVPLWKLLEENYKKPVEAYVLYDFVDINKNKRTINVVAKGVDKITRISGTILIPVDDDDVEKLRHTSGWATFLDGGYVKIENVADENTLSPEGFIKVSDISIEKVPISSKAKDKQNENQN